MQDTSEIVIITGYRVCKMDPPMGGGGVQLVCVCVCVSTYWGAGKSVHEGNLLGKCNSVSGVQKPIGPLVPSVHGSCIST